MEKIVHQDEISNQLNRQEKLHTKKKLKRDEADYKHECDECGEKYLQKCHLDLHINKVHKKMKQYICLDCGKTFYRDEELKAHALIHTGEKPLTCVDCSRIFRQRQTRDEHNLRMHIKIKSFICLGCDKIKTFYTLKELKLHSGNIHPEVLFPCIFCSKSFIEHYTQIIHQKNCSENITKRPNE